MPKMARMQALNGLDGLRAGEIEVPPPGPGEIRVAAPHGGLAVS